MSGTQVVSIDSAMVESLVTRGDLSAMPPQAKAEYYLRFCESLGLDPKTQPFQILKLSGREVLYAGRGATDQLARNFRVTRDLLSGPEIIAIGELHVIRAICRASLPDGRSEVASGLVPGTYRTSEELCNAFMKAETKAKRRATLSLLGLGMMDESERDTLPEAVEVPLPTLGAPEQDPKVLDQMAQADARTRERSAALKRLVDLINPPLAESRLNADQRREARIALLEWAHVFCEVEGPFEPDVKKYSTLELDAMTTCLAAHWDEAFAEVCERLTPAEEEAELLLADEVHA